ncbi:MULTISPECIES: SURF1 family protein [unclassified Sphingomonas]|jgi:surfeit locus 1 family protein|uniref:SURF1 family protein n=1 Tax=unclassified Sphingomonas TaxID=196159 RepID=UPI000E106172|nr:MULTISPECIES: SURF1 family protein [unclassified Sphingomonas]AXJ95889.1 SURF1 family protein [Sphingomonas sp. FARSPH]
MASRSPRRLAATAIVAAAVVLLIGLGIWQVERLQWKRALIAQTERQLRLPPVPVPGPDRWATIGKADAYRPIVARGTYRPGRDTYVQAVTEFGGGFWVVTPLDTDAGFTLLVNRGFLPATLRGRTPPPVGPQRITGLLRLTEPRGAFLRHNDPAADRWYSRDVTAIATARGLARTAPYFIDAREPTSGWPRGGLTVVRFPNNHLVYAITWFGLAALVAFMAWRARRRS